MLWTGFRELLPELQTVETRHVNTKQYQGRTAEQKDQFSAFNF